MSPSQPVATTDPLLSLQFLLGLHARGLLHYVTFCALLFPDPSILLCKWMGTVPPGPAGRGLRRHSVTGVRPQQCLHVAAFCNIFTVFKINAYFPFGPFSFCQVNTLILYFKIKSSAKKRQSLKHPLAGHHSDATPAGQVRTRKPAPPGSDSGPLSC